MSTETIARQLLAIAIELHTTDRTGARSLFSQTTISGIDEGISGSRHVTRALGHSDQGTAAFFSILNLNPWIQVLISIGFTIPRLMRRSGAFCAISPYGAVRTGHTGAGNPPRRPHCHNRVWVVLLTPKVPARPDRSSAKPWPT
jgi:hypothetical protein